MDDKVTGCLAGPGLQAVHIHGGRYADGGTF